MALPPITSKQKELLLLIARFRFLNRPQLQTFLQHTTPTRINDWLKDLTAKNYLGRIYSTSFTEKTKPAIYYLSLHAIQLLRAENLHPKEQLLKLYRENERSTDFIAQCLLLADIYLEVTEQTRHGHTEDTVSYVAFTAPDLSVSPLSFLTPLAPDLVLIKKDQQAPQRYHLLTILEPVLPQIVIRKKIRTLLQFYFSGTWEEQMDSLFPIILLVSPTKPLLISTKRLVKKILEENQNPDLFVQVALEDDIRKQGVTAEVWEMV